MENLNQLTDRQLLELIYLYQVYILAKVSEIDNDDKQFGMNLAANLMGTMISGRNV